jgi:peptidoglycan-associated lipoprotein
MNRNPVQKKQTTQMITNLAPLRMVSSGFLLWVFAIILASVSCSSTKVKDGKTAYEVLQYARAVELLEVEYQSARGEVAKAQIAYMLGKSYQNLLEDEIAEKWLRVSVQLGYGNQAMFDHALALKKLGNYERCIDVLEDLRRRASVTIEIDREIQVCRMFLDLSKLPNPENVLISELSINSGYNDYSSVIYQDEYLVVTSDRILNQGTQIYNWTGNSFSNLLLVNKFNQQVIPFHRNINSEYNDGTPTFTQDFKEMVFTRCFHSDRNKNQYCRLMYSKLEEDGDWSIPEVLPFLEENRNYGDAVFFENDEVLIFSSMSKGGGHGYDLWYVERYGDQWSFPELMPQSINSPGHERFPTVDGDTLYFSSDYLPGYGGLDIFKTWLNRDGSWEKPVNIGPPFNSSFDDFALVVDRRRPYPEGIGRIGYFSSSRPGRGTDKLFMYQIAGETFVDESEIAEEKSEEDELRKDLSIYLAGRVFTDNYKEQNGVFIKSAGRKKLNDAIIFIVDNNKDTLIINSDRNGLFIIELKQNSDYKVTARKDSYLNSVVEISTRKLNIPESANTHTINTELTLNRFEKGKEIVLENIYYDFDEWFIREDAKPALNTLVKLLIDNPDVWIELSAHTDCRGSDTYNMTLSQRRAQSVVNYLIDAGIARERLSPKGYGKTQPVIDCICEKCSEDDHQTNRRTSFTIK